MSGLCFTVSVDNLKQGRHGTRVAAQEDNLVALLHVEVHIIEKHCSFFRFGTQSGNLQNLVTRFTVHRKDDTRIFTRRRLDFIHIQFLQHLLTAGSLLGFRYIGRETTDKFFQFLTFFFCLGLLVLLLTESQLAGFIPEAIVTGKEVHLAEVDVHRMRTYRVKEVTVVAYHQHGMFKVRKVFFEPGHRIHIQVIGRLVEQQVVRISEKRLCQHHAHLFLTTQITHQRVVLVFFYAQPAQQDSCIALGIPAFQFGKLFFQFGCLDTVFIGKIFLGIQSLALLHDVPKDGVSHQYGIEHRVGIKLKVVLAQHRKTFARSQGNATLSRVQLA